MLSVTLICKLIIVLSVVLTVTVNENIGDRQSYKMIQPKRTPTVLMKRGFNRTLVGFGLLTRS